MIFFNELISAIIQLSIFTAVPFLFYVLRYREAKGFFKWIGLKKPNSGIALFGCGIFLLTSIVAFIPIVVLFSKDLISLSGSVYQSYANSGWSIETIGCLLVWGLIKTALSEEIFFRGFLNKILREKLGFLVGASIQSLIFGFIHIFAVFQKGIIPMLIVCLITSGVAFIMTWFNEKKAGGSIVYSWIMHGLSNILSVTIMIIFFI